MRRDEMDIVPLSQKSKRISNRLTDGRQAADTMGNYVYGGGDGTDAGRSRDAVVALVRAVCFA